MTKKETFEHIQTHLNIFTVDAKEKTHLNTFTVNDKERKHLNTFENI